MVHTISGTHETGIDLGMKVGLLNVLYTIKAEIIYFNTIYLVNLVQSENDEYKIQKIDSGAWNLFKNSFLII